VQRDQLLLSQTFANPRLVAKNTSPFSWNSTAYFAMHNGLGHWVRCSIKVATFDDQVVVPGGARRDSHDLLCGSKRGPLMASAAVMSFVLGCGQVNLLNAFKRGSGGELTNSLSPSTRRSPWPILKTWNHIRTQDLVEGHTTFAHQRGGPNPLFLLGFCWRYQRRRPRSPLVIFAISSTVKSTAQNASGLASPVCRISRHDCILLSNSVSCFRSLGPST
jgi:hypothetical protein